MDQRLRIGTLNASYLGWGADDDEHQWGECPQADTKCRAVNLADRILKSNYDIIALNEVFDDGVQELLRNLLHSTFPHSVNHITGADLDDSGLMLFSRFPFAPPRNRHIEFGTSVTAESNGDATHLVSAITFDSSASWDAVTAKGAGHVRIQDTRIPGRFYNVVFTHMQASKWSDDPEAAQAKVDIRRRQLAEIELLVLEVMNYEFDQEELFIMGDVNINGIPPTRVEYDSIFNSASSQVGLFIQIMKDGWMTTSADDLGATTPFDQRLDYIFHNVNNGTMENRLCLQHMQIAVNLHLGDAKFTTPFGPAGVQRLSEHLGVNAELTPWTPQCSPSAAFVNPSYDETLPGNIQYRHGAQWWRLSNPRGFQILTDSADFEVYHATDLTTPLRPYNAAPTVQELENGRKFVPPPGDVFIKITRNDGATGPYSVRFHKNACTGPNDTCVLNDAATFPIELSRMPVNGDDTLWFEVPTDVADAAPGETPSRQTFQMTLTADKPLFFLALSDMDGNTLRSALPAQDGPQSFTTSITVRIDGLEGQRLILRAQRLQRESVRGAISWRSDLSYFSAYEIHCVEEEDDLTDEDEIGFAARVDGQSGLARERYLGNFEIDVDKAMTVLNRSPEKPYIAFVNRLDLLLTEYDDTTENQVVLTLWPYGAAAQGTQWDFNDGIYELTSSHVLDTPPPPFTARGTDGTPRSL